MISAGPAVWRAAPLLLGLCVLFWAGNAIAGRALAGSISPYALSFWRWLIALVLVTPFAWRGLRQDAPELRRRWKLILALAMTGVTSFGLLLYVGLQTTTALNGILLQAAIPPLVMLLAWLVLRERTRRGEIVGIVLSLIGVVAVITKGRPWDLLHLGLNGGDGIILVGVGLYAIYSLLLRRRPAVAPLSLLWATFAVSALVLAPAYVFEAAMGQSRPLTWGVAAGVAYVAVFPSFLAYLFYNRGIELIGAARASQFLHLQPVFGAVLAVLLLGEPFRAYHAAGFLLIAAGIGLSAWAARAARPAG
ncbi:MAG: DMT family transporter [Phenylobacterium sp.]|nr:DMT family transporter [Phenylobacterium sp.]